jgi:hypothetical protein
MCHSTLLTVPYFLEEQQYRRDWHKNLTPNQIMRFGPLNHLHKLLEFIVVIGKDLAT